MSDFIRVHLYNNNIIGLKKPHEGVKGLILAIRNIVCENDIIYSPLSIHLHWELDSD